MGFVGIKVEGQGEGGFGNRTSFFSKKPEVQTVVAAEGVEKIVALLQSFFKASSKAQRPNAAAPRAFAGYRYVVRKVPYIIPKVRIYILGNVSAAKPASAILLSTVSTPTTTMTELDGAATAMVAFDYLDDGPLCMILLNYPEMTVARINGTCAKYLAPADKLLNVDLLSFVEEQSGDGSAHREKLRAMIDSVAVTTTPPATTSTNGAAGGGPPPPPPPRARARNIEMVTLRDEDSGFPIKRHFDWTAGQDKNGQILLFGDPCSDDDVEQRAKDVELIDFFQNAPIAMHWLSGEGKVLWANQTELKYVHHETTKTRPFLLVFVPCRPALVSFSHQQHIALHFFDPQCARLHGRGIHWTTNHEVLSR
jgi:hypothetical protein